MTTTALPLGDRLLIGASSAKFNPWESINWRPMESLVNRLQMRIAKATKMLGQLTLALEILERSEGKLSCCVLMGASLIRLIELFSAFRLVNVFGTSSGTIVSLPANLDDKPMKLLSGIKPKSRQLPQ